MPTTYQRIINSMPPLGGITPVVRSLKKESENLKLDVVEVLEVLRRGSCDTGLTLTVDNLHRLVRLLNNKQETCLPPLHKGVSYNPNAEHGEEWLMLLDFFALLKSWRNLGVRGKFTILDASWYWMVNQLGDIPVTHRDPTQAAEQLLRILNEESERVQPWLEKTIRQRNSYLHAIATFIPQTDVITMPDLWKSAGLKKYLTTSLELFCDFKGREWQVTRAASYHRHRPYSPWFTPLVAAEQAYLSSIGYRIRLAPVAENSWGGVMRTVSRTTNTEPYAVLMYDRPRRLKLLTYREVPSFGDSLQDMEEKFLRNPFLVSMIGDLVIPFVNDSEKLSMNPVEAIYDFASDVHRLAMG